jgi:HAD superfamily phosphoserine phosphatase-like hydrolase
MPATIKTKSKTKGIVPACDQVSVVIPVLNESSTISRLVRWLLRDPLVGEVLVVDDGSVDNTPELAAEAGGRVITSSLLGKGASMEDGLQAARFELVVYLDGDLRGLCRDLIQRLVAPIQSGVADFVKAKFERQAGRVTELTARPLLRTYFPELSELNQPLGGIIAARRCVLRRLRFENDYGVDIGLLIDALAQRARVAEVDIGPLKHDSQSLKALGEMATQVARTILERAAEWGRLRIRTLQDARERDRVRKTDPTHMLDLLHGAERLALFDMDGTLLAGRFVVELARATGRVDQLSKFLDNHSIDEVERAQAIAKLFTGVPKATFERVAREIPLMCGAPETIVGLRRAGYLVGIVTDSYRIAAETVRRRVFADFAIANVMQFRRDKAIGKILPSPAYNHPTGCKEHQHCKARALEYVLAEIGLDRQRVLAVGDGMNDVCLLRAAGRSVAFNPKADRVRQAADSVLTGDLRRVLSLLEEPVPRLPELRAQPFVPSES